jgi:hypothetical protein
MCIILQAFKKAKMAILGGGIAGKNIPVLSLDCLVGVHRRRLDGHACRSSEAVREVIMSTLVQPYWVESSGRWRSSSVFYLRRRWAAVLFLWTCRTGRLLLRAYGGLLLYVNMYTGCTVKGVY